MNEVAALTEAYAEGMREGQQQWIPVEEKLPEENCWVLTHEKMTSGNLRVRFFCAGPKSFLAIGAYPEDVDVTHFVTHWQPLPALPLSTE